MVRGLGWFWDRAGIFVDLEIQVGVGGRTQNR